MTPGTRKYKRASCEVVIPQGIPPHLQDHVREITSLESQAKGNGHATELMNGICSEADGSAMTLMLAVKAYGDGGLTELGLLQFYGKHGFAVAGSDPLIMVRAPKIGGYH